MNRTEATRHLLDIIENHSYEKVRGPLLYPPSHRKSALADVRKAFDALEVLDPDTMAEVRRERERAEDG